MQWSKCCLSHKLPYIFQITYNFLSSKQNRREPQYSFMKNNSEKDTFKLIQL